MSVYRTLELDGQTVRYFEFGRGVTVLYIHGFCMSSESCENMVPHLHGRCRLIGVDLPGFGGSTPNFGFSTIVEMAEWVKKVVDALGITRFILAGHSMGGYIALDFAKLFPEYIIGMVLIHSTALADRSFKKEERDRVSEHIKRYGYEPWVRNWVKGLFHMQRREYAERVEELCYKASETAVHNALKAMRNRDDSVDFLKKGQLPILFLAGRFDKLISYSELRVLIIESPSSRIIMLENAGHMGMYEDPESCADAIISMTSFMTEEDRTMISQ